MPESVLEDVSGELSKLTKSETVALIAVVCQALFYIPGNLLGPGFDDIWNLSDKEAAELAEAIHGCLKTLPTKQSKKVEKFLKEYAPLLRLLMVSAAAVYPRYALTMQVLNERKSANIGQRGPERVEPIGFDGVGFDKYSVAH